MTLGQGHNEISDYLDQAWQQGFMNRTRIWLCLHCDLDLGDLTWVNVMTLLCRGQLLRENLS